MKYVQMYRYHRVTKEQLQKYPLNSVWVDVWHEAFPSPDGKFNICMFQSEKHYRDYWSSAPKKRLGYSDRYNFKNLLKTCAEMTEVLGLTINDFNFHGSTLGDTDWFRGQLKQQIEVRNVE